MHLRIGKICKYVLNEFDSTWGVKGLIVTHSNLVVTWKVRPHMSIFFLTSTRAMLVFPWWLYFDSFLAIEFSVCAKPKKQKQVRFVD